MTGGSATSTPRNGRGLAIRSRLWLARPAYPAIRQPSIAVSGGEPDTSGSSGLYVHSIRTLAACQAPFISDFAVGEEARVASRSSRECRALLSDGAESGVVCLLSQPFLTRTVRRFTCLPLGSPLGSVGVASWRCRTSRRRHAGMRCLGMGDHPAAAAGQASPESWARAQVSLRCETGTGARASCSLEGLRRPASRSGTGEPGVRGLPEIRAGRTPYQ